MKRANVQTTMLTAFALFLFSGSAFAAANTATQANAIKSTTNASSFTAQVAQVQFLAATMAAPEAADMSAAAAEARDGAAPEAAENTEEEAPSVSASAAAEDTADAATEAPAAAPA